MRVYLTILIILFALTPIHSQELKTKTKKNRAHSVIERYTVLKASKSIKHGEYVKMTYRGKILEKGYFKNNKKDSVWVNYSPFDTDTVSIGKYLDDKPTGRWIFYEGNEKIKYSYDYSTAELIGYNWYDTPNRFPVLINNRWIESEIDNPPLLIGVANPLELVQSKMSYPPRAAEKGVSGQVIVAFTIDSLGKMSDLRMKRSIDADLDAEAMRVVKLLGNKWFPAKKDGKAVTIEYFFRLIFYLQ